MRIFMILIFIFSPASYAQGAAEQAAGLLKGIRSMSASFTQTTRNGLTGPLQKSSGTLALQRPDKFRWVTVKPNQQYLISDGRTLWIYDVLLAQVTQQRIAQSNNTGPAALLSASVSTLKKRYRVQRLKSKGLWFRFIPRNKQDMFAWLEMHFTTKGAVDRMNIKDNLGQQSWFRFSRIQLNKPLRLSLFHFIPPKGVDVIKSH